MFFSSGTGRCLSKHYRQLIVVAIYAALMLEKGGKHVVVLRKERCRPAGQIIKIAHKNSTKMR